MHDESKEGIQMAKHEQALEDTQKMITEHIKGDKYMESLLPAMLSNRDGMDGTGLLFGLIFGSAISGNNGLFGNRNNGVDNFSFNLGETLGNVASKTDIATQTNAIISGQYDQQAQNRAGQEAIATAVGNQGDRTVDTTRTVGENLAVLGYNIKDAVTAGNFATSQGINGIANEICKQTYELNNSIHAEGEATRALINANTTQSLRDALEAERAENLAMKFGNFPITRSAKITDCGADNTDIITINNNVNAIGSSVNQLSQIVAQLIAGQNTPSTNA